jgi:hypothetical protein
MLKMDSVKIIDISVLTLKPNSILVARVDENYSKEQQQEVAQLLVDTLKRNDQDHAILVLPNTTELSVIEPEDEEGSE